MRNFKDKKIHAIGSIEMVLILVLVSLLVIFRAQILTIINSIFSKVTQQINAF